MKNNSPLTTRCLSLKSGFTLLELLVVLAIFAIMTGAVFATKNNKKATTDVETVARQVAAQIRFLQNEALTGKQFGTDVYAHYFKFDAVAGSSKYTISYNTSASGPTGTPIAGSAQQFDLTKKRITFGETTGLHFESPLGKPNAKKQITVTSVIDPTNTKMYICVGADGSVVEQKSTCP